MDIRSTSQENSNQRREGRNLPRVLESDNSQIAEPEGSEDSHAPSPDLSEENESEDFEIILVDGIPNPNSDELISMNTAPSIVGAVTGCLQQLTHGYLPGILETPWRVEVPNLGVMNVVGTLFNLNAFPLVDDEEIDTALNELLWSKISSFSDELRFRQCFQTALLCNCTEIVQTLCTLSKDMFMGFHTFLEKRRCINQSDISYLNSKHDDLSASTRILFCMITHRDLKTLFTFIWTLKYFKESLYQKITLQLNADTSNTSVSPPLLCLRCILIDRVEACLVADHLLSRCNNLRKWYMKVIDVGRSETERLWKELFDVVKSLQINMEVREAILEAIEKCGFHSDILKMLQEDKQLERNSFECRCSENHADSADESGTCKESSRHYQMSNYEGVTPNQSHTEEIYQRSAAPATCAHFNDVQNKNPKCERREDRSGLPYTCFENQHHNHACSGCATHPHKPSDAQDKNLTSERLTHTHTSPNDQMNSNSLKRKKSDVGDENAEGSQRKKSSLFDESSTSLTMTNSSNHLNVSDKQTMTSERCNSNSDTSSESKDCKRGSENEDTLKMDELKEAVDIQPDSGMSPDQSLGSFRSDNSETDKDSGYYDKSTGDKDETVPKVIAVETKSKLSQPTDKAPLQSEDQIEQGTAASDSSLEVIDADHPENTDLNVNHDVLIDALDESLDESAPGSIQDVNENETEGANSKKSESSTRYEPFINIQVKKTS